eukprot:579790-Amorphochlora_amoeboformis.AAC.1
MDLVLAMEMIYCGCSSEAIPCFEFLLTMIALDVLASVPEQSTAMFPHFRSAHTHDCMSKQHSLSSKTCAHVWVAL